MVRKRNIFADYDFDYEEHWINDMAGRGLLLSGHKKGFHLFEESENTHRRYSIIPRDIEEFGEEEKLLYQDEGWELLFGDIGRTYFYTDDPDAPAIFTDELSYAQYLRKNKRTYTRRVISSVFIVLIWTGLFLQNIPGNQTSLSTIAERDFIYELVYLLVVMCTIATNVIQGVAYHNAVMRITGKKQAEWSSDVYRRKNRGSKITFALAVIFLAAAVIYFFLYFSGVTNKVRGNDIYSYNEPSPVLLREFSPDEWQFVEDHRGSFTSDGDKGAKYSYSLYHTSNLTLKEGYKEEAYFSESVNYSDWELPEYTSLTYEFRSVKTADRMLMKRLGYDTDCGGDSEKTERKATEIALNVPEADYAGYYEDRSYIGNGIQYLYLRKGSKVVYVSYHGKQDILDLLSLFEEQLM